MNAEDRYLTEDDIYGSDDLRMVDVEVPEWPKDGQPGVITLRELSADDAERLTEEVRAAGQSGMYLILLRSAVRRKRDEAGTLVGFERLFQLPPATDPGYAAAVQHVLDRLRQKNINVLNRLQLRALELNGMTEEARQAIKNVLGEVPPDVSRTASPSTSVM